MKKFILVPVFLITVLTYTLFVSVSMVSASGGCVPVYGGGVSCPRPGEVLLDKKVRNPATGIYVDNLGPTDPKYKAEQMIIFHITVKNPGETTIEKITLTDTLPALFDYVSSPGNYDLNTGKVTWEVNNLAGGGSQTFEIRGKISNIAKFPAGGNVICPTNDFPQPINIVDASASNSQTDRDETRYCLEKEIVLPKKETPKAGPEAWIITIPGLLTSLGIGLKLRRQKI